MKTTIQIQANFWYFPRSFRIQLEIKCKMTADVWSPYGKSRSNTRDISIQLPDNPRGGGGGGGVEGMGWSNTQS